MELITIFVFQAIAGIVIAIRLRFVGEKGRFALPIAVLIVFASCYIIGFFVRANSGLKESISYMIGETGRFWNRDCTDCIKSDCMVCFV